MALIGPVNLMDSELRSMVEEEDPNGNNALNENVSCMLLIILGHTFMVEVEIWIHKT